MRWPGDHRSCPRAVNDSCSSPGVQGHLPGQDTEHLAAPEADDSGGGTLPMLACGLLQQLGQAEAQTGPWPRGGGEDSRPGSQAAAPVANPCAALPSLRTAAHPTPARPPRARQALLVCRDATGTPAIPDYSSWCAHLTFQPRCRAGASPKVTPLAFGHTADSPKSWRSCPSESWQMLSHRSCPSGSTSRQAPALTLRSHNQRNPVWGVSV